MLPREGHAFIPDQFVITSKDDGREDVGYILRYLPGAFYELSLLSGHRIGSGFDPVYVSSSEFLRSATVEEVLAAKREWESSNNRDLPFTINTIFEGINLIGSPEQQST